ncbi:MAG TPA: metallophosphoesterase family protein [Polyangia bacterium]|nr:metallophosphoesterase family protein [Polyangia bacterium]
MVKPLRRFLALGDAHAEDALVEAAIGFARARGVEAILQVGDVADGHGSLDRTCALLAEAGALAVRGNHDRWFLANELRDLEHATPPAAVSKTTRAFLAALPATRRLETAAGPLLLCHGVGERDMVEIDPDGRFLHPELEAIIAARDYRLLVNGHSHKPMVRQFAALTVINAGTLHRDYQPGFVIVELDAREASFYRIALDGTIALDETLSLASG